MRFHHGSIHRNKSKSNGFALRASEFHPAYDRISVHAQPTLTVQITVREIRRTPGIDKKQIIRRKAARPD